MRALLPRNKIHNEAAGRNEQTKEEREYAWQKPTLNGEHEAVCTECVSRAV